MLFISCVCHAFTSVHCCLLVTCWKRADLLALDVMHNCVFVTVPCGILGQIWYWNVSIPDLCRLSYFTQNETTKTGFLATMSIFGMTLVSVNFTIVVPHLDQSFFENTKDPDQMASHFIRIYTVSHYDFKDPDKMVSEEAILSGSTLLFTRI